MSLGYISFIYHIMVVYPAGLFFSGFLSCDWLIHSFTGLMWYSLSLHYFIISFYSHFTESSFHWFITALLRHFTGLSFHCFFFYSIRYFFLVHIFTGLCSIVFLSFNFHWITTVSFSFHFISLHFCGFSSSVNADISLVLLKFSVFKSCGIYHRWS